MKIISKFGIIVLMSLVALTVYQGCKSLKQIAQSVENTMNLKKLQFKLNSVNNFRLANVDISNKKAVSDFSIIDGANLLKAYNSKSLPAQFTLNIDAKNPNDGTSGSTKSTSTLTSFDWRLIIDDVPTITGNIDKAIEIPGVGKTTTIPLSMNLDLYQYFTKKGSDGIVNLACAIGGVNGSTSHLKLDAKPTVTTPFGNIAYPSRITIIDKEYK